jgi:chromosome segregation ATPase
MEKILEGVEDFKTIMEQKDDEIRSATATNSLLEEEVQQLRSTLADWGVAKTELELRIAKMEEEIETYKSEIRTLNKIKNKHYPAPKSKRLFDWL